MAEPVAKLALDTRSWGPAFCGHCDSEVEDVILMSDASFVCSDCMTPMEGEDFERMSQLFVSATPTPPKNFSRRPRAS